MLPGGRHGPEKHVKYGERVLLQHSKTGCNLTVRTAVHSENAPNCFTVDFGVGHQFSASDQLFRILPKYKIRQEGEYIRLRDQVLRSAFVVDANPLSTSLQLHSVRPMTSFGWPKNVVGSPTPAVIVSSTASRWLKMAVTSLQVAAATATVFFL